MMNAPLLRKGSVVTPQTLLEDKLDVLEWERKKGFITNENFQGCRWAIVCGQEEPCNTKKTKATGKLLRELEGVSG